jgi:peptidoglycan-associated lipoprotein
MQKALTIIIILICSGLILSTCSKKTAGVQEDQPETVAPAPTQPTPTPVTPPTPTAVASPAAVAGKSDQKDNTDKNQGITVTATLGDQVLELDASISITTAMSYGRMRSLPWKKSARLLKQNPTAVITIEGHCDERGTVEYNIALGERRAYSVKNYFIEYGLNPDNLVTISYGKEKPVDPGHDEDAWSKNRRAAIVPNQ